MNNIETSFDVADGHGRKLPKFQRLYKSVVYVKKIFYKMRKINKKRVKKLSKNQTQNLPTIQKTQSTVYLGRTLLFISQTKFNPNLQVEIYTHKKGFKILCTAGISHGQ